MTSVAVVAKSSETKSSNSGLQIIEAEPSSPIVVFASGKMTNEIITPFSNPKVISETRKENIFKDGNTLYVTFNGEPWIQLIIKDGDGNYEESYSLTLSKKDSYPGQHYKIVPASPLKAIGQQSIAMPGEGHNRYIVKIFRDFVRGKIPSGYSLADIRTDSAFQLGPFTGMPEARYVGHSLVFDKFIITNNYDDGTGIDKEYELVEQDFYSKGVKAVAFFPKNKLSTNESTYLYVLREKESLE